MIIKECARDESPSALLVCECGEDVLTKIPPGEDFSPYWRLCPKCNKLMWMKAFGGWDFLKATFGNGEPDGKGLAL